MSETESIFKIKNALTSTKSTIDNCHLISDLGLDSLSLIELVSDIEDELDISISANHLYELQTVSDLRNYIHSQQPQH